MGETNNTEPSVMTKKLLSAWLGLKFAGGVGILKKP